MQPIDHCFSTCPLLHRLATSTASTTTVGGKVAATYLGGASLLLDDFVLFSYGLEPSLCVACVACTL